MAGVRTSAGSTIAVTASAPATFNAAGYDALTPTLIGEVTDLGEFGREYEEVTHQPLANRSTQKFKGGYNEGTITLQLGLDEDDAGQTLLETAVASDADYYFKIVRQNGRKHYFPAKVMSFKKNIGARNSITSATVQLSLTTNSAGVGIVNVAS